MTYKFDVLAAKKALAFSNFSKDFRQTNYGVPLRMDRHTLLKWISRHMASFAEETGDHLLRSAFFTNNFRWLLFEDALFRTHTLTSMIRHL